MNEFDKIWNETMGCGACDVKPCEDCISRKEVLKYIDKMPSELTSDGRRMIRRRTLEEYISDTLPSVTPQIESREDCIRREDVLDYIAKLLSGYLYEEERERLEDFTAYIAEMPSVTPEIPNPDVVEKMKKAIDEMTEIHSDGEFYIKNVDAKWIIGKYLYGAEMRGGREE